MRLLLFLLLLEISIASSDTIGKNFSVFAYGSQFDDDVRIVQESALQSRCSVLKNTLAIDFQAVATGRKCYILQGAEFGRQTWNGALAKCAQNGGRLLWPNSTRLLKYLADAFTFHSEAISTEDKSERVWVGIIADGDGSYHFVGKNGVAVKQINKQIVIVGSSDRSLRHVYTVFPVNHMLLQDNAQLFKLYTSDEAMTYPYICEHPALPFANVVSKSGSVPNVRHHGLCSVDSDSLTCILVVCACVIAFICAFTIIVLCVCRNCMRGEARTLSARSDHLYSQGHLFANPTFAQWNKFDRLQTRFFHKSPRSLESSKTSSKTSPKGSSIAHQNYSPSPKSVTAPKATVVF